MPHLTKLASEQASQACELAFVQVCWLAVTSGATGKRLASPQPCSLALGQASWREIARASVDSNQSLCYRSPPRYQSTNHPEEVSDKDHVNGYRVSMKF